jgi:hypothetical protein
MGFYKDLSCLSNPKAFPSFAELSKGSALTPAYLELGESQPHQFFFCEYVKILDRTHYRSEIEVKDKTGATVRLALCFGELQDYMLPIKFEEECETLLLLNPKRTILRDGKTEGIEITDPSHIKVGTASTAQVLALVFGAVVRPTNSPLSLPSRSCMRPSRTGITCVGGSSRPTVSRWTRSAPTVERRVTRSSCACGVAFSATALR